MKREDFLTPAQVARDTKVSPFTIRRLCANGTIRATKVGSQWRIYKKSYQEWLQAGEPQPGVMDPSERPRRTMRALVDAA